MKTEARTGAFSTFPQRLAVAAVAIPLILWAALEGGVVFFLFVSASSALALWEFYGLLEKKGIKPLKSAGLIFGLLVNFAFLFDRATPYLHGAASNLGLSPGFFTMHQFLLIVIILFIVAVSLVELFRPTDGPLLNAAGTLSGVFLVSLFFGTLVGLRELFPFGFPVGRYFPVAIAGEAESATITAWGGYTVIVLLGAIWMCDTAAYLAGAVFGRHKLFERVSPGKTWEGAIAGFIVAVLAFWGGTEWFLEYLSPAHGLVLGAMVGTIGQAGDLVESRFKRDAGVKDASSLLPGHGGIYDRFDSLLFLSPVVYLYIDFIVLS